MMAGQRFSDASPSRARAHRALAMLSLAIVAAACERQIPTEPMPAAGQGRLVADVQVLVGFTTTPGAAQVALIESVGGRVTHQYRNFPIVSATIPAEQQDVLAAAPGVKYVSLNTPRQLYGGKQIMDYGVSKVDAPGAWSLGFRGNGVKVAIFDTGIDVEHSDLVVAGGVNFAENANGAVDPANFDDCHSHGTHVAGIVGARNNGRYTVGVAPHAQLYAIRFFDCVGGGATAERELMGIDWAIDNGMDVVNMSFGGVIDPLGLVASPVPDPAEQEAMDSAYARGVVLIAASGNSSTPYVSYPAGYASVVAVGATDQDDMIASFSQTGSDQEVTAPGVTNLASVPVGFGQETSVHVATDNDREVEAIPLEFAGMTGTRGITEVAVYANFGTPADYAAASCAGKIAVVSRGGPTFAQKTQAAMDAGCAGLLIHNIHPGNFNGTLGADTAAGGVPWIPVVSITLEDGLYLKDQIAVRATTLTLVNAVGNLGIKSGTSMASPHAAGVAALVLSKNPGLTPSQVRQVLRSSADDLGPGGWDPVFGYGRVNAKRAVQITP